jgi:hypothetical protein
MDVVKFGGITGIDDMVWEKIFPDDFKRNRLELKLKDGLVKIVHKILWE